MIDSLNIKILDTGNKGIRLNLLDILRSLSAGKRSLMTQHSSNYPLQFFSYLKDVLKYFCLCVVCLQSKNFKNFVLTNSISESSKIYISISS